MKELGTSWIFSVPRPFHRVRTTAFSSRLAETRSSLAPSSHIDMERKGATKEEMEEEERKFIW